MFYIESNGFAATTWLAKLLNSFDYVKCAHGSRNFELNTPLGSDEDLSENDFIQHMLAYATISGQICGAIQGKYSPQFREKIIAQGGRYYSPYVTRLHAFFPAIAGCKSKLISNVW